MHLSDVFVFHDYVPISDRSYTRRCKINSPSNAKTPEKWLSVPIASPKNELIYKTQVIDLDKTLDQHFKYLTGSYHKAPFYHEVFAQLDGQLEDWKSSESIAILNIKIISYIARQLDIYRDVRQSSSYKIEEKKDQHNLQLVKQLGGTVYLSGTGAKAYQDEDVYKKSAIQLVYINSLSYLENHKKHAEFKPSFSILDALFNIGWSNVASLIKSSDVLLKN